MRKLPHPIGRHGPMKVGVAPYDAHHVRPSHLEGYPHQYLERVPLKRLLKPAMVGKKLECPNGDRITRLPKSICEDGAQGDIIESDFGLFGHVYEEVKGKINSVLEEEVVENLVASVSARPIGPVEIRLLLEE